MADIDRVFAQFHGKAPSGGRQREVLNIRRRGRDQGVRAVEVVHARSERPPVGEPPGRPATMRSATWSDGFPVKPMLVSPVEAPAPPEVAEPKRHVMPAWQPAQPAESPGAEKVERMERPHRRGRSRALPTSADPFDEQDEGANCLRCGHRIQEARARRGLMTCAGCG